MDLFSHFGAPQKFRTDGGLQFASLKTREFYKRWGVRQVFSAPDYPQSNGLAESAVKTANKLLQRSKNQEEFYMRLLELLNTSGQDNTSEASSTPTQREHLPIKIGQQVHVQNKQTGRSFHNLYKTVGHGRPADVKEILDEYYAHIVGTQEQQPCSSTSPPPKACGRQSVLRTLCGEGLCHETLLHSAASKQDIETVTILLDAGADINALDSGGYTPLDAHIIPTNDSNEVNDGMTRLLLERNATLSGTPRLPLHEAAQEAKMSTIRILLEYGADPNAKQQTNCTLHYQTALCMVVAFLDELREGRSCEVVTGVWRGSSGTQ
ncbi:unnamed protein product [Cyprideis torosa]|uniref:Uncharacterized protein n=1 Tax=Cyprideis torosa TaxID=163714 RepID=A0A7R8WKY5_9CRUS|nr:unnamed protein product [Cyprideis torosa]CAG0897420.1 unnamed protein product [Cyprideis torosa]